MKKLKFFRYLRYLNVLIVSTLMLNLAANAAYATTIDVSASNTNLTVGETFHVDFNISGLTSAPSDSLSAFDLDILFDNSVFSLTGFDFTDPILGNNQLDLPEIGAFPFDGDVFDLGNGVLDAYGISGNSDLVLDADQATDFRFLGLTFFTIAEASSTSISIDLNDPSLLLLDSYWGDLGVNYAPAQVDLTVSTNAPVPEPATILLFASGLPLLSNRFRKSFGIKGGKK